MDVRIEHSAEEIKGLQRCITDLVSILALPAIWTGGEPTHIASTLLDVLLEMFHLDLVYARLNDPAGDAPIEMVRVSRSGKLTASPQEIGNLLSTWLGNDPQKWPAVARKRVGNREISIVPLRLGLQDNAGFIAAGSERTEFPRQTERLLLTVAANQAAIGLQEAWLRSEQKRIAKELDQRVAQRTIELAHANEDLRKEIVERKRTEEKLRRSEAFLAEGQYLSRMGNFAWRVATNEITWSEQLYRIFEFDPGMHVTFELIGTRIHDEDLSAFKRHIEQCRSDGGDVQIEFRLQMPGGSIKHVHVIAHEREEGGQREYIGAVQDVTQRRLSEEALAKARSELAHVARVTSLGVMTASIAHEVNQPLSGIITNAGTCLRMLSADPPNVEGALETARRTIRDGNRASDVIKRLRALFTKKESATESVDLNEATEEVIALSLSELQESRVVLRREFTADLPPVTGDRVQLQQVVLNLLRNASDAMRTVEDRARELLIRTERVEGGQVRLSVKDAGAGFDPQAMDRLFESFYTTKNDGMGIGLSVSRSIVEAHQGRLWATPNDGPGATFSFAIPYRAKNLADVEPRANQTTSAMGGA